jgi:hypothetical protein
VLTGTDGQLGIVLVRGPERPPLFYCLLQVVSEDLVELRRRVRCFGFQPFRDPTMEPGRSSRVMLR